MSNLPPLPVQGDSVIAKATYIRGQFAKMEIIAIEGEKTREEVLETRPPEETLFWSFTEPTGEK